MRGQEIHPAVQRRLAQRASRRHWRQIRLFYLVAVVIPAVAGALCLAAGFKMRLNEGVATLGATLFGASVIAACMGAPFLIVRFARDLLATPIAALGCCTVCGYDLRGSGQRCPECGQRR